jgi:hypothetical protein
MQVDASWPCLGFWVLTKPAYPAQVCLYSLEFYVVFNCIFLKSDLFSFFYNFISLHKGSHINDEQI